MKTKFMKRLIMILGAPLLLSACCQVSNEAQEVKEIPMKARRFTYEGHRYIMFLYNVHMNGVVHDPDCPCNKEESNGN